MCFCGVTIGQTSVPMLLWLGFMDRMYAIDDGMKAACMRRQLLFKYGDYIYIYISTKSTLAASVFVLSLPSRFNSLAEIGPLLSPCLFVCRSVTTRSKS